jgi:predicted RND superfamily exporter protein
LKKLFQLSIEFPKAVILTLLAVTLLSATQLHKLQVDVSAQSMMVKEGMLWNIYQQSLRTFGSDSVAMVVVRDADLFTPDKLKIVEGMVAQFESLDFVESSSSLFSVPNMQENDDFISLEPFLKTIPSDVEDGVAYGIDASREELQGVVEDALENPLVAGNLISLDGKTVAINLVLRDHNHDLGHDAEVTTKIEEIITQHSSEFEQLFQMSTHFVRSEISTQILEDQFAIMPLALLVLIVILGISLRSFNCAVVPLSTSTISIVITLALMALFGITLNVLTSIIPALLIIVGSTEDVHLMAEFHDGLRHKLSRDDAVAKLYNTQSMAILLAFITTFVGFLSIVISELELLREFGLMVSLGLLINFVVTVLFVPAYLKLFGTDKIHISKVDNIYQRSVRAIFSQVIRFKGVTLSLLLGLLLYFSWGAQYLQSNNNTLSYFAPESDIRERADAIHQQLAGMQTFSIVLDSGIEGTFLRPRYLQDIEKIQSFIDKRGVFDRSLSFADFVKIVHRTMDGLDELMLPEESELVSAYMGLVQFETVAPYVDEEYSVSRILVRHNISESTALMDELLELRHFIEGMGSPLTISFTGESMLTDHAADVMAWGQFHSLTHVILVIMILVSILFFDLRAGIVAILPNIFPLIVLFGVMGYFKIPLDIGTAMVAVVAIGICVDDTIHFLTRYHYFSTVYTDGSAGIEEALMKSVSHEATPIITTSIALAFGFLTLTFSSFQPVVNFGALSALVMFLALFSNFILTPILLSYIRLTTAWDLLSTNMRNSVLEQSVLFEGMNSFQMKKVMLSGVISDCSDGDIILEQGGVGSGLYIILAGKVSFTHRESDGSTLILRSLGAGEVFGEVSSLSGDLHYSRVSVDVYAKILTLSWERVNDLRRFYPRISSKLFSNLSIILSKRVLEQAVEEEQVRALI